MSFFNSAWLWAATAIAIPIAIHLWNARKGKPIPWATIQFLQEKENQTSRGLQLDHILLLVLPYLNHHCFFARRTYSKCHLH